jgi:hypothetical protein
VAELDLWIEADSVLSVSSCKFLFELLKNPLSLRRLENDVVQRAPRSKEITEADAFLCDLDPSLGALCISTPLL